MVPYVKLYLIKVIILLPYFLNLYFANNVLFGLDFKHTQAHKSV